MKSTITGTGIGSQDLVLQGAIWALLAFLTYAALSGWFPVDNDQLREWSAAWSGWNLHQPIRVGASSLGANPQTFKLFLAPLAAAGVAPGPLYSLATLFLAAGTVVVTIQLKKPALLASLAVVMFGPGMFWFRFNSISSALAAQFSLLAGILLLGRKVRLAAAVAVVGGMTYYASIPFALILLGALIFLERGRKSYWLGLFGLIMLAVPYLLVVQQYTLSSYSSFEPTFTEAVLFLGGGGWVSLLWLVVASWTVRLNPVAWLPLTMAVCHWLVSAAGLSFKSNWWSGFYTWNALCIAWILLFPYIPVSKRQKRVIALFVMIFCLIWAVPHPAVQVTSGRGQTGAIHQLTLSWALVETISHDKMRVEGEIGAPVRWGQEYLHRGRIDRRSPIAFWTRQLSDSRCIGSASPCRIEAELDPDGPLTGETALLQIVSNYDRIQGEITLSQCLDNSEKVLNLAGIEMFKAGLLSVGVRSVPLAGCQTAKVRVLQGEWLILYGSPKSPRFREGRGTDPYLPFLF